MVLQNPTRVASPRRRIGIQSQYRSANSWCLMCEGLAQMHNLHPWRWPLGLDPVSRWYGVLHAQQKKLKQFLVRRLEMSSWLSEMAATCPKTVARINLSHNRVYACAAFAEIHCVSHLALRPIVRCGIHLGPNTSIIKMILVQSHETTRKSEFWSLFCWIHINRLSLDRGKTVPFLLPIPPRTRPEWFDPLGTKNADLLETDVEGFGPNSGGPGWKIHGGFTYRFMHETKGTWSEPNLCDYVHLCSMLIFRDIRYTSNSIFTPQIFLFKTGPLAANG